MKAIFVIIAATMTCQIIHASGDSSAQPIKPAAQSSSARTGDTNGRIDTERRADKRLGEMLDKMQAAVEEIAQLYGNPVFLQVYTNDPDQAAKLKLRLGAARASEDIRRELTNLEKKREDLLNEIALKEREVARLSGKLVRQRAALDSLAEAVERARNATEDTVK
jgi:hypothetical protein